MSEPILREVSISHSSGGKVAIIKFDVSSDYNVFESRKFEIPEDWTDGQIEEFVSGKRSDVRNRVDALADAEFQERWAQCYLNKTREAGPDYD